MRVRNRLLNFGNKIIYQDDEWFAFSLDSVLLANFVTVKLSDKKIVDFCTGNAPVPMLLSFRTRAKIYGIEIQKEVYELGNDSVVENGMDEQIELILGNVRECDKFIDTESVDVVTCNPPYFKYKESSLINENRTKSVARHEVMVNLEEIIVNAKRILKNGGTLAMVHRPDRMIEIIDLLKKYNFEPKRLQLVYPKMDKEANILLIEATKNGKSGLKVLSPLISHSEDGTYTEEVRIMFGDDKNVAN